MNRNLAPVTTDERATLPRTIRGLVEAIEAVGGAAEWEAPRRVRFTAPRRMQNGTYLAVVGHAGWFVRDGRNHVGGRIEDVRRAAANVADGRDPYAPRRDRSGAFTGRDRQGRFAVGSQSVCG